MQESNQLPSAFDCLRLDDNACFLCGSIELEGLTREHVFPKWLQGKHDLWDKKLVLLNKTAIPYRQLLIPCCENCNSQYLSSVENAVREAVYAGYAAVNALPPLVLYQWMAKIFYGILRKEITLLLDRRSLDNGSIVPRWILEKFSNLHFFLQSIRLPFDFIGACPFTTLVVNLHEGKPPDDFFFHDDIISQVCGLVSHDIGVIVALQDSAVLSSTYGRYVSDVAGRKLNILQFHELFAKSVYQVMLVDKLSDFVVMYGADPGQSHVVSMLPQSSNDGMPPVSQWSQYEYARVLLNVLKVHIKDISMEDIFSPPDRVLTWMSDEKGDILLDS